MNNKKLFAAAACAAALFSNVALAQANSFSGWSLGLNVESAKTTTSPLNTASENGTSASLSLQPQYTWALGNNFVIGTGITIGMGDNKSGVFAGGAQETALRSRLSFDLLPGYAFSNTLLGYAKVSSVGATYELNSPGNPSISTTLSGMSYGMGLRAMISKGVFLQAEYDTVKYNRVLGSALWDIGVDANVFSVGLGYKF